MRNPITAAVVAVGLCALAIGIALSAESNVFWRADLHQGTSIIAYGQGSSAEAALQDCYRLQATAKAMTAAETRRNAVAAISAPAVRWCNNPRRYSTVSPDPVAQPVNCAVSDWSAWSNPAWEACIGGQQTRALVRTRTIVTQPANGGTPCPVLVETQSETRPCSATATISWQAPTQNTDGSALTDLAGYRIHYGRSAAELTSTVQIANPSVTRYVIENLSPGTWFFAARAFTAGGRESELSNIGTKVVL